jgi:hypothetical protein
VNLVDQITFAMQDFALQQGAYPEVGYLHPQILVEVCKELAPPGTGHGYGYVGCNIGGMTLVRSGSDELTRLKLAFGNHISMYQLVLSPTSKEWKITACECGSEAVGSPRHSSWCPKHSL